MQNLFHRCGQTLDVHETFEGSGTTKKFVFLDSVTGDGYDRCPGCGKSLTIGDFTCQKPKTVSQEKQSPSIPLARAEGRRLIRKARAVIASRRVARAGL